MQSVRSEALDAFSKKLDGILAESPKARRELHERLGVLALAEVKREISASISDSGGTVGGWQESRTGSYGGYAAVRAKKGSFAKPGRKKEYAYGYLTNALETGHKTRHPSGTNKRYRPRIKKPYVNGRHFYRSARSVVERKAIDEAQRLLDELTKKLEG